MGLGNKDGVRIVGYGHGAMSMKQWIWVMSMRQHEHMIIRLLACNSCGVNGNSLGEFINMLL